MARKGRRSRLTQKLIDQIHDFIERGATDKIAYNALHIPHRNFYRWKALGKEDSEAGKNTNYAQLYDALQPAEANFQMAHIENIAKASIETWQASAWLLERKFPETYARRQTIDMTMDWPIASRIIGMARDQLITYNEIAEEYGDDLAGQLFQAAGITVQETSEA